MTRAEVFQRVECWVIMLALENFPAESVWAWNMSEWKTFYKRIKYK